MKLYQKAIVIIVTAVYIVLGGVVIHFCEMDKEVEVRRQLNQTIYDFLGNNTQVNISELKALLVEVSSARSYGVEPIWPDSEDPSKTTWDFYGSMFFAATVVTTIGFGNLVPRTNTGRTFVVFFALIGIVITAATVAIVSTVQLVGIDKGLTRLMLPKDASDDDKKQLTKRPKFRAARILLNFFIMSIFFAAIPSLIFTKMEGWTYSTALYFTFVTMTTVGFGDYVAGAYSTYREWYRLCVAAWILLSLASCAAFISTVRDSFWLFGGEDDEADDSKKRTENDRSSSADDVDADKTDPDEVAGRKIDYSKALAALCSSWMRSARCCPQSQSHVAPAGSDVDDKTSSPTNGAVGVAGTVRTTDGADSVLAGKISVDHPAPLPGRRKLPPLPVKSKTKASSRKSRSDVVSPQTDVVTSETSSRRMADP